MVGLLPQLDSIGLISLDDAGDILTAASSTEDLFGYRPDEIQGRSIETLIPGALRLASGIFDSGPRALARPLPSNAWLQVQGVHKEGREIPLEAAFVELPSGQSRSISCVLRPTGASRWRVSETDIARDES